ncbi:MAG: cysteine desulfurase, partial [Acidimicrobiales bacterium]|nr:cysteine desulfurase [Acidimicrobiales bacterium]
RAYLDHASTSPLRPEARDAMVDVLDRSFANPSGAHAAARAARQLVDESREIVAEAVGARPGEVVFTSGGTEADNLAVTGVAAARPGPVLCSAVEHPAVAEPARHAGGGPVPVDRLGRVDLDALEAMLEPAAGGPGVALVSVMAANNEVGTVQPLDAVAEAVRRLQPAAALHTDAVQAVPWLDVAVVAAGFDLVSLSAHKFGGPKGVGALVVRGGLPLTPLLRGGGQERARRSGTENVVGIVGLAAALSATVAERADTVRRVAAQRDRLADGLVAAVPGLVETGVARRADGGADRRHKVAGACHVCIDGIESESLLFLLEEAGVHASAASACASGAVEPSPVLAAMGVPRSAARGALRLSLGATTTDADVDRALAAVPAAVDRLRRFS